MKNYRDELGRPIGELSKQSCPPAVSVVGNLINQPWGECLVMQVLEAVTEQKSPLQKFKVGPDRDKPVVCSQSLAGEKF